MSAKHTPGPWRLDEESEEVVGADDEVIHAWWGSGDDSTAVPNARLIAAAPDLLEALHRFHPDVVHTPNTYERAVEAARAAIAKAEEGS